MTAFRLDDEYLSLASNNSDEALNIQSEHHHYEVISCDAIDLTRYTLCICDNTVYTLFSTELAQKQMHFFLVDANENKKTLETVTAILHFFASHHAKKSDVICIMGGGITQEVGAFACGLYKRGIAYHHFPTTLLSMADSCIGGKAGLNFAGLKNQLGIFNAPHRVYLYDHFLKTLPNEAILSGLGEIFKACIIGGHDLVARFEASLSQQKSADFKKIILSALHVKKAVVEKDEFETKIRAILNYGHTFGHAIEAFYAYHISHGQSVVIGILLENILSFQLGYLPKDQLISLAQIAKPLLPQPIVSTLRDLKIAQLCPLITADKKVQGNAVHLYLLNEPGSFSFHSLPINATVTKEMDDLFQSLL